MLCRSRILKGVEVWRLDEAWEENNRVQGKFCKELIGLLKCAANVMAEIKVVRHSTRRKTM
jgi:hypothetical protein